MEKLTFVRLFFVGLTFVLNANVVRASELTPKIEFSNIGDIWKNVSSDSSHPVFYSPSGSEIFVSCKAPYPIQWNIIGTIGPAEIVKIQPPKRNLHENMFEIKINFFFRDAGNFSGLAASAQVACEMVNDHNVRDYFSVFVKGNNPFVQRVKNVVTDSKLIPCPTTDPTSPTTLHLQSSDGVETPVEDVTYIPTEGFRSDKVFNGVYVCRKESTFITISASATETDASDHQFSPFVEQIQAFSDESIEFTCSSKTTSIMVVLEESPNATLQFSVDTDKMKTAKLSVPENLRQKYIKGKLTCVTANKKEMIKEWTYEFIEAPVLYLDNFEGEVDCLSPLSPKMAQTVRCRNSMDCNFMEHCFQNVSLCNFKKQKQFFATADTSCWVEKLKDGRYCSSVPYSHLNGKVQCTVLGLTKTYEFFVALDFLRYSNWKDAPEKELLRMDEMPEVLYTNHSTQFFCTGSAYIFADSLSFEIEYKNGSKHLLQDDNETIHISNPYSENPRKVDEFNVLGVLNISLPIDAVAIHCIAPWWNSTDIMVTSSKFETKQLLEPVMPDVIEDGMKQVLYKNESNQRLVCYAKGEPQPKYEWFYRNDTKVDYAKVNEVFPSLTTSIESTGKGFLEFLEVNEMHSGEYKCEATNSVGSVSRIYQVQVSNMRNPCVE